ncbi:MAG: RagB/SusD family nutrient uptake outer membrane protein [Prevotellaceae bacterium]|nr:RagB/SusD family nutrient uptake outer membrane protein [Prevotellaceae bacterium]
MKIKSKINIAAAFAFCLALFSGCEAFLDTVPDNRTELDTDEKIERLLVSAYPQASYASYANAMADDATCRAGTSTRSNTSNEYIINEDAYYWREARTSTHNDSPTGFWNSCYKAIATANHALEAIEASANPDALRYQRSEALLCRAFSHFLLVTLFSKPYIPGEPNSAPGIPYADKPETEVLATYERKTVQYVYQRIEEDITEALKNLPPESEFKVSAYHFTAKAALTFASRFYLYKGEFEKVVELTTQVVPLPVRTSTFDNVPANDPANTWAATYFAAFKSWGTTASVIQAAWRLSESKHNFLLAETNSNLNRSWTCQYGTVQSTVPSNSTTNVTGGYWPFTDYNPTSFRGCFYIYKFSEYFYSTSSSGGWIYVMFPFIRAEEVILNRIEAEIHLGRLDAAVNDFNVYYRQRSGASSQPASEYSEGTMVLSIPKIKDFLGPSLLSFNFLTDHKAYNADTWDEDKRAMMLLLLETRRSEYVHEGWRWFDVLRFKIPAHHKFMDGSEDHLMPDDPRRQWQIPETAIKFGLEPNER